MTSKTYTLCSQINKEEEMSFTKFNTHILFKLALTNIHGILLQIHVVIYNT